MNFARIKYNDKEIDVWLYRVDDDNSYFLLDEKKIYIEFIDIVNYYKPKYRKYSIGKIPVATVSQFQGTEKVLLYEHKFMSSNSTLIDDLKAAEEIIYNLLPQECKQFVSIVE